MPAYSQFEVNLLSFWLYSRADIILYGYNEARGHFMGTLWSLVILQGYYGAKIILCGNREVKIAP